MNDPYFARQVVNVVVFIIPETQTLKRPVFVIFANWVSPMMYIPKGLISQLQAIAVHSQKSTGQVKSILASVDRCINCNPSCF